MMTLNNRPRRWTPGVLLLLFLAVVLCREPLVAVELADSMDYEQIMKQHHVKLSKYTRSAASYSPTANQNSFDVTYYDINLKLLTPSVQHELIVGTVGIHATALQSLNSIDLNLFDFMTIDSIIYAGQSVGYTRTQEVVTIATPPIAQGADFSLKVFYHGLPIVYGFGSFSFSQVNSLPMIASLSEPYFARTWWPCKDHPTDKADSVDMTVTVDSRVTVVSNGLKLSEVNNGDGTSTTHWHESYPIATYLVSLAIADYDHYADTLVLPGHKMPVDFYIFPGQTEVFRPYNSKVVGMLEFFSSIYGEYPFIREKYGHAQFLWSGGMEHQTCASIGVFPELLLAHELAHQWWGDMITCGTWHDIWLNEGFARYSEALWVEHTNGLESYHQYMNQRQRIDRGVYVEDTTDFAAVFDLVVYDKGSLVLHMLRYTVGDENFFAILKAYSESNHKYGTAVTGDFQAICEEVSGRDLDKFFEQWVYQPKYPDHRYGFFSYETDSGWTTDLRLRQIQTGYEAFQLDIDMKFEFAEGDSTIRLINDARVQNYHFDLEQQPLQAVLDPDNWIVNGFAEEELPLSLVGDSLQSARVGHAYSRQLEAIAGRPPFAWSSETSALPYDFQFSEDGLLSGTASDTGSYIIPVTIRDASEPPRESSLNLLLIVSTGRGDVDLQPGITLTDILFFVRYLYRDGPAPADPYAADMNCDGGVDIVDVIALLNHLYDQAPFPCSE